MDLISATAAVSAIASAFAASFAAWTAIIMRKQMRFEAGADLLDRFNRLNDALCRTVGPPPDGIDPNTRQLAVELLALYERAFAAHQSGVLDLDQWTAAMNGFNYWIRRDELSEACSALLAHDDAWQAGFVEYVQATLARSPLSSQERILPPST